MTESMDHGPAQPDFLIKEILPDYLDKALTDPDDREYAEIRLTSLIEDGFDIDELKKLCSGGKNPPTSITPWDYSTTGLTGYKTPQQ